MVSQLTPIGFAEGIFRFLFGGIFCVGIGVVLTLTGIGAIFGIPLAIVGFLMIIGSPFAKTFCSTGTCPHCGKRLFIMRWKTAAKCRGCKKRLRVDSDRLLPLA